MRDVDGVNAGYARLLLDDYLDNPEAVPAEWRALFENGDSAAVRDLPGLARLLERLPHGNGAGEAATAAAPAAPPAPAAVPQPAAAPEPVAPTEGLAARVAEAAVPAAGGRSLGRRRPRPPVRRRKRCCSAASPRRWRSSRPTACTAISRRASTRSARSRSATRRSTRCGSQPKLTPELQARIPASVLRVHVERRHARRGAAAAAGDLLRLDGLRDRAHRRPLPARLAAQGDRVVALPDAARARRAARASTRASARSRGSSATCAASFLGQKQFSLEGLDVLIPMLDDVARARRAPPARARS